MAATVWYGLLVSFRRKCLASLFVLHNTPKEMGRFLYALVGERQCSACVRDVSSERDGLSAKRFPSPGVWIPSFHFSLPKPNAVACVVPSFEHLTFFNPSFSFSGKKLEFLSTIYHFRLSCSASLRSIRAHANQQTPPKQSISQVMMDNHLEVLCSGAIR